MPLALRQITHAAVATLKKRGNKDLRAEHILILNEPSTWVFREFNKQGTHHRKSALGAILRLCINIRHKTVFHLSTLAERLCEALAYQPRLCWRSTMRASVTAKESKRQPTTIDVLWRSGNEAAHIVTPECKTAKTEGYTTTKVAKHTGICGGCITTPMQRIALGTRPCGARPDDTILGVGRAVTLISIFLNGLPESLVIANRIEVVFIEACLTAIINAVIRSSLAEVALYDIYALLY